ncbi:MAG TPA: hypothetical protein VN279_00385 [Rhodocyclaceae bacterium]|nr:hypothetical protein [Rhodocyclaceae bacterium]
MLDITIRVEANDARQLRNFRGARDRRRLSMQFRGFPAAARAFGISAPGLASGGR